MTLPTAQTPVTPQSLVEHGLVATTADDCIVIVRDATSANLRWANNTLTTNGVMHGISVTAISFVRGADGVSTGSVSGSATTAAQVTDLVRGGRRRGPGRHAGRGCQRPGRRRRLGRLGRPPRPDRRPRLRRVRARPG